MYRLSLAVYVTFRDRPQKARLVGDPKRDFPLVADRKPRTDRGKRLSYRAVEPTVDHTEGLLDPCGDWHSCGYDLTVGVNQL